MSRVFLRVCFVAVAASLWGKVARDIGFKLR